MVLTDLIARHRLEVPIATLETGKLHAQTLELIERTQRHYRIEIEIHRPQEPAVITFVRQHGDDAMFRSIELRKACCKVRKLEPLSRMLAGREAWIAGLRREQSDSRGEIPFSEIDGGGRVKLHPIADWTWNDVWYYIASHDVPYNPLHDAFMPSIGCAPCTRAIGVGEDFRAGRWWWESASAKECGLHVKPNPAEMQTAARVQADANEGATA
jgi:phosphoadenosine phosphosulfate reductase